MPPMLKLLIVKTSSLGDVIHCLPVIADIHTHFPSAQIDWVVEESFADIPRMHASVNQVYTVAMRRWKKAIFSPKLWIKTGAETSAFKKLIKQNQYDAIIDCQGLLKSALISREANGVKHGYNKQSIREPIASRFYDKTYNISYQQHAVTRNRALCALSLGYANPTNAPNYGIGITAKNNGSEDRTDTGLQGIDLNNYVIALHGTSRDSKLWPVENWVNLGKELAKQNLNLVLPWASDAEFARAEQIANQLENATVLPKLNIAQIANVISNAKAAVGVDTGLSHLAAALNIPTIAIYTDTNPALTGVMAGKFAPAINLGGVTQTPTVGDVLSALKPHI
jgi:heptosyltransferase I